MEIKQKSRKLFGTDGIRGKFGDYPFDNESLIKLGNAVAEEFKGSRILIASDTRESAEAITDLLVKGVGKDCEIYSVGVVTTPALSYETAQGGYDLGIMITASHNPYWDNGLKFFRNNGEKIENATEERLEKRFFDIEKAVEKEGELNRLESVSYSDFICEKAYVTLPPAFRVVLDCANGAAYKLAPAIFRKLGFDIVAINCEPDGRNINEDCGSMSPEGLLEKVLTENAELGIAYDGDGDRVIFVDRNGNILDGDHTIGLLAEYFKENEPGFNSKVVGTVMANLGLEKYLEEKEIELIRADVGDKHVYEGMKKGGIVLGGEQSGHTILSEYQNTGDGILTSLFFIKALFFFNISACEIFNRIYRFPQVIENIVVKDKKPLEEWDELNTLINDFNEKYENRARILIRYSGTEPKIRVMVEAEEQDIIDENLNIFCELIRAEIGLEIPEDEAGH